MWVGLVQAVDGLLRTKPDTPLPPKQEGILPAACSSAPFQVSSLLATMQVSDLQASMFGSALSLSQISPSIYLCPIGSASLGNPDSYMPTLRGRQHTLPQPTLLLAAQQQS